MFISAFSRYKGVKKPKNTELEFGNNIMETRSFDDIVHYWGIFSEGKMIGYSTNYIFDNIEANYFSILFHPSYLKLYSSYALFYTMNKYYLQEKDFKYVNDVFRSILHETEIQDFLQRSFLFKKAYTNLYVIYNNYFNYLINILKPVRPLLEKISPRIKAIYLQDSIRKKCSEDHK